MSELSDGRIAAWISAWNCVESAQRTRTAAMKEQDRRFRENGGSDASHYFSQMTQQYNGLMEEARIFAGLAAVPDMVVGVHAGDWLRKMQEIRAEREAEEADFVRRFTERRAQAKESVSEPAPESDDNGVKGDADESSS